MVPSCAETEVGYKPWLEHQGWALSVGTCSWCQLEQTAEVCGARWAWGTEKGPCPDLSLPSRRRCCLSWSNRTWFSVCVDCVSRCCDILSLQRAVALFRASQLQSGGAPTPQGALTHPGLSSGSVRVPLSGDWSMSLSRHRCLLSACPMQELP